MFPVKTDITISGQEVNPCEGCSHKNVCKNLDILRAALSSIESASVYEPIKENGIKEIPIKNIPWLSVSVACKNWSPIQRTEKRGIDIYDT